MAKAAKRKPPSRARYEQNNPTVSCRVPKDTYERFREVKAAEGMSFADILKVGLGLLAPQIKGEAEVRKKAYTDGYARGRAEAEHVYEVAYACVICGKPCTVTSQAEKDAIKSYMRAGGWGHQACHDKR